MRNYILIPAVFSLLGLALHAQRGRNQFNLAAEATIPVYQNDFGWGFFAKGMYGIGQSAQFTLMTGYSVFKSKNSIEQSKTITRLVPVLLGYKYNIKKIYIEPQAGYGELGGKIDIGGDYARPSAGAFFWAIGGGYDHKKVTAGIRFQQAHGTASAAAGIWNDRSFHHTSIHVGYKLF